MPTFSNAGKYLKRESILFCRGGEKGEGKRGKFLEKKIFSKPMLMFREISKFSIA